MELEKAGVISHTRQRDWFDPTTQRTNLTVIGTGGIGSLFTIMAGKLGVSHITIYDGDYIEAHNMPNQFFPLNDHGYSKVESVAKSVEAYTIAETTAHFERVTPETTLRGIVVSGVDSMAARKDIAEAVKKNRFKIDRYFDARIGGEEITIYSVNPKVAAEWALYEKTLYSDEEAREDPCTRRSVIDVMAHVGAHLLTSVREYISGVDVPQFVYINVKTKQIFHGTLENTVG